MQRKIYTNARRILSPDLNRRVVLNVWTPGYYIIKKMPTENSKIREFVPTTTIEAALAYLKNYYGAKEYLKYKEDAHPGHAAVETPNHYLSVSMGDEVQNLGFTTSHPIVHSDSLEEDVIAMKRFPENRVDLYTLNCQSVELAIMKLIETEELYSLLGDRFGFANGESCATASHLCLRMGGIDELLTPQSQLLSRNSILTPALLLEYVRAARKKEQERHVVTIEYSKNFDSDSNILQKKYNAMLKQLDQVSISDDDKKDDQGTPGSIP